MSSLCAVNVTERGLSMDTALVFLVTTRGAAKDAWLTSGWLSLVATVSIALYHSKAMLH